MKNLIISSLIILSTIVILLLSSCETVDPTPYCELNRTGDINLINDEYNDLGPVDFYEVEWSNGLVNDGSFSMEKSFRDQSEGRAELFVVWEVYYGGTDYIFWVEGYFTVQMCNEYDVFIVAEHYATARKDINIENPGNFHVTKSGKIPKSEITNYSDIKTKF